MLSASGQTGRRRCRRPLGLAAVAAAAALMLGACSSTSPGGATGASSTASPAPPGVSPPSGPPQRPGGTSSGRASPAGSANTKADVTVAAAAVPGVGTVLVNGNGLVLYTLSTEAGGAITCTHGSQCTEIWADTELPAGMTSGIAGSGIEPSKLGVTKDGAGNLYVTYAGWPLYIYAGDSGPRVASGQGKVSFGGIWETITPAGARVGPGSPPASPTGMPSP